MKEKYKKVEDEDKLLTEQIKSFKERVECSKDFESDFFEENKKTLEKENIKNSMSKLNDIFIEKNISAGGSADLLILTIFIHLLTDEE